MRGEQQESLDGSVWALSATGTPDSNSSCPQATCCSSAQKRATGNLAIVLVSSDPERPPLCLALATPPEPGLDLLLRVPLKWTGTNWDPLRQGPGTGVGRHSGLHNVKFRRQDFWILTVSPGAPFRKKNKMKQKHFRLCLQDVRVPLPLSIHFPSSFYQIQFVWEENVPRSEQRINGWSTASMTSLFFRSSPLVSRLVYRIRVEVCRVCVCVCVCTSSKASAFLIKGDRFSWYGPSLSIFLSVFFWMCVIHRVVPTI